LNGDGKDDFLLGVKADYNSFSFTSTTASGYTTSGTVTSYMRRGFAQGLDSSGNNMLLGGGGLIRNLVSGATISSGQTGINSGVFRASTSNPALGTDATSGAWNPDSTGFAGIKFANSEGGIHNGWIRVRTESNANGLLAVEVLDWAFQDEVGQSILAGQIPEPSTLGLGLLAAGALGVGSLRRNR